jgi:uncharacterized protein
MKSRAVGAVPVALVTRWLRREEETAPWPTTGTVNWSGVVAFVLLAIGLGWAAWIGLRGLCPLALRTYIAAFAPMFAAIAVLRVQRRGSLRRDRRVGLKRVIESIPESILGICLVGAAVAAGVGLSLLTGTLALRVGVGQNLLGSGLPIPLILVLYWVTAFGEEYGWRGFLVPQLAPLGGLRISVFVAFLCAVWHVPPIFLYGFDYPAHQFAALGIFLAFAVPFTVLQTWLRAATRGLAAPVAAHATLNLLAGIVYANFSRANWTLAGPMGLLGTLPFAVGAIVIVVTGRLWWEHGRRSFSLPLTPITAPLIPVTQTLEAA